MRSRITALCVLMALAMSACGDDEQPGAGQAPAATTSPPADMSGTAPSMVTPTPDPAESSPATVPGVLDFTAPLVDGGTFDGSTLAGTPTVLWFWAPWCPVCKAGAADVMTAAATLGDAVAFVGVAGLSGSVDDMQAFVDDTSSGSIPHVADIDGAVFSRFEVVQQDTFAFISTDGTVALVDGYSSDPDLVGMAHERFGL
jgi:thiol-disulfide isomerase/thioredoxin